MLPAETEEFRACLRYLHKHLKAAKAPELTREEEHFYLMALGHCTLATLKVAFRTGIGRWRWMPRPADILDVYREVAGNGSAPSVSRPSGCEACGGTGWQPVPGRNAVTPCVCPRGRARQGARRA